MTTETTQAMLQFLEYTKENRETVRTCNNLRIIAVFVAHSVSLEGRCTEMREVFRATSHACCLGRQSWVIEALSHMKKQERRHRGVCRDQEYLGHYNCFFDVFGLVASRLVSEDALSALADLVPFIGFDQKWKCVKVEETLVRTSEKLYCTSNPSVFSAVAHCGKEYERIDLSNAQSSIHGHDHAQAMT